MEATEPEEETPKRSLPEWMPVARPFLKSGVRFDLEHHPFLRDIYADTSEEMVLMKAGQMGLSEYLISLAYYISSEHSKTVLYVMPTDRDVSDFSTQRIGTATEQDVSPHLFEQVKDPGGKTADRVGLKRVGKGWIYLRGGRVSPEGEANQLHSIPADLVILDEFDLIDERALPLIEKRLGHSDLNMRRLASTPTYHERGIHLEYLATDRRVWLVKCDRCGGWQPLEITDCVKAVDALERPTEWLGGEEPYLECRRCKGKFNRFGKGEWVAQLEGRARRGYHIPGLASHYKNLRDIIGIGSNDTGKPIGLQSIDESTRKQVINQDLGLPYTPRSATRLTDRILELCKREYAHEPPVKGEGGCFMGVDVGNALHIVIRSKDGRQRLALAGNWEDLPVLMTQYKILACVIDALPETKKAREFQAMFPTLVWLCYYNRTKEGKKSVKEAEFGKGYEVDADRTRTLDSMFAKFLSAAQGEVVKVSTLPADIRRVPDYYAHMKAPMRTLVKNAQGQEIAVYVENGPDHFAHSENYCHIASLAPLGWVA